VVFPEPLLPTTLIRLTIAEDTDCSVAPGGLLGAQCAPMPDTRGDVLCPTCGLWTPPAPFCTECGAVLQVGLQETASGGGSDVFRRGHEVEQPGSPWGQSERFEPEPEDQAARAAAAAAAGAAGAARVDHFAEIEPAAPEPEWPSEPGLGGDAPPVRDETHPGAPMGAAAATAAAMAGADDDLTTEEPPAPKRRTKAKAVGTAAAVGAAAGAAATGAAVTGAAPPKSTPPTPPIVEPPPAPPAGPPPVTYAGPPQDGGDDGNSGVSGLVFVLFLGLGILALLGGAILGGVFDGGVAEASPTPSASVSTPSPEPSLTPSASASTAPSSAPSVAPPPTPVPASDGFIARAEPCDEQPSDPTCDNSGAVNNGHVWILVSFRHGQASDVIGVSVRDGSGSVVDQGSFPLNFCGAITDCAGYTFFEFSNLADGDYDVVATRNGDEVATTAFTVE
jgi:hypothetical protein